MRLAVLRGVEHRPVRFGMRRHNRVGQAHQATRLRERVMRRVKSAAAAHQRFLTGFSRLGNLFRSGRHLLSADQYRAAMRERVATWREVAALRAAWCARDMRRTRNRRLVHVACDRGRLTPVRSSRCLVTGNLSGAGSG